jgi:hypothetical protein
MLSLGRVVFCGFGGFLLTSMWGLCSPNGFGVVPDTCLGAPLGCVASIFGGLPVGLVSRVSSRA